MERRDRRASENGWLPFFIRIAGDTQIKEARACRDSIISSPRPRLSISDASKTKEIFPELRVDTREEPDYVFPESDCRVKASEKKINKTDETLSCDRFNWDTSIFFLLYRFGLFSFHSTQ